jgi:hypothetical protein
MLFCVDQLGLKIVAPVIARQILSKWSVIILQEIAMSEAVLDRGYNISCVLEPYRLEYRDKFRGNNRIVSPLTTPSLNSENDSYGDVWYPNSYFGRNVEVWESIFVKSRPELDYEEETLEAERQLIYRQSDARKIDENQRMQ